MILLRRMVSSCRTHDIEGCGAHGTCSAKISTMDGHSGGMWKGTGETPVDGT